MINEFIHAMNQAELGTKEPIVADGRLHRFHVKGDKIGSCNGWYVLFDDDPARGSFGSWRTGEKYTWHNGSNKKLSLDEYNERKRKMADAKKQMQSAQNARYEDAKKKAHYIWNTSNTCINHPYLSLKAVKAHFLRIYRGVLIIPIRDALGVLWSLQFIDKEGQKRFLSGGKIKGGYFAIGKPRDVICIAEGYATAASIYEATGYATAAAFNAGNLKAVAQIIRRKFKDLKIIICADNDIQTKGNPGLTKAREAALAVNGLMAVPNIEGDFNDLFKGLGS